MLDTLKKLFAQAARKGQVRNHRIGPGKKSVLSMHDRMERNQSKYMPHIGNKQVKKTSKQRT